VGQFPIFKNTYLCYDLGVDFPYFIKMITKGGYMKKKLLVLLVALIPTLMPNLVFAVAIDIEGEQYPPCCGGDNACCLGPGVDCNFMPCSWCD
jgi:hypothetical protein